VLLGLIVTLAITGALVLGSTTQHAAQNLAQGSLVDGRPITGNGEEGLVAETALASPHQDQAAHRLVAWAFAVAAVGLIMGCAGPWLRKRRHTEADQEAPPSDLEDLDLDSRIYTKRQDLLHALISDDDLLTKNHIAVRHLMTQHPLVVSRETGVEEMKALMVNNRIHHLLVCENENRLVGIVSDRDVHARRGKTAQEVMTPDPCCVAPDSPLSPAISCLINRKISCLPVVEDGRLCGVITTVDMALIMQCVLQLWLQQMTQTAQTNLAWSAKLAKVATMVDREMEHQQGRLVALTQTLDECTFCGKDNPCRLVPAQIEEILAATKRLTGLITETYSALQEQCRRNAPMALAEGGGICLDSTAELSSACDVLAPA